MNNLRTAIMGAGSIGTIAGALITKNGGQVDLVDSFQVNVDALNEKGARVTGHMELNVPVHAILPAQMEGIYDLVIILTKQTTNNIVLKKVVKHIDENSLVLTLQNGIPEYEVAGYVGKERTAGGTVGFGGTWLEPGVSELSTTKNVLKAFAFDIGCLDGQVTTRLIQAQELLKLVGNTIVLDNLMGVRWSKLLMNATFSGMSAALGCIFGHLLDDDIAIQCIAHIADEVIKCAHACGVRMVNMQGHDYEKLELFSNEDVAKKLPVYREIWGQHYNSKASMLQDLEKGRPTEINHINGLICKTGRKYGVHTPFNDKVVELVKRAELAKCVNDFDLIKEFLSLLEQ